jgi:Zn finger protein HypA/HybF involved in hydrogenase expression
MSTKLLSPELEFDLQKEEQDDENNDQIMKSMKQEIECPRCSDVMILSSDFDGLLYFCQECHLSLVMK